MQPPEVSVIIPVWRDWDRLDLCLHALANQTLPASRFEIIVANNEAEPRDPPACLPPNGRMIHAPEPGSYAARNAAVSVAQGDVLAFTDADCIPERDWLENGLELLRRNGGGRVTGPVTIFREEGGGYYACLHDRHMEFRIREHVEKSKFTVTANMLVSRKAFDEVGSFDGQRFSGGDSEWNHRATAAGIPIVYSEAVEVAHPARKSLGEVLKKKRRRFAGGTLMLGKLEPWRILSGFMPPLRFASNLIRERVGIVDAFVLFIVVWAMKLVSTVEGILVYLKLKAPNRS